MLDREYGLGIGFIARGGVSKGICLEEIS